MLSSRGRRGCGARSSSVAGAEQVDNFLVLREASFLVTREEQRPVGLHVEDANIHGLTDDSHQIVFINLSI